MSWRQYDNISDDLRNLLFKASFAPICRKLNTSKTLNKIGRLPKRVIICGSPRSGTTLMNEMMRCFDDIYVLDREEYALRFPYFFVKEKYVVTKHPLDFESFDKIIDTFDKPYIIFMIRDPRDVIVSKHFKNKNHYLVNFSLWKKAIQAIEGLDYPHKTIVRYERLIEDPTKYEKEIGNHLRLGVKRSFSEFYVGSNSTHQDIKSLGGLRPIDSKNSSKYLRDEHRERIREQIAKFPEISGYLIKYGYEADSEWEINFL